jgi:hypothetical protein
MRAIINVKRMGLGVRARAEIVCGTDGRPLEFADYDAAFQYANEQQRLAPGLVFFTSINHRLQRRSELVQVLRRRAAIIDLHTDKQGGR